MAAFLVGLAWVMRPCISVAAARHHRGTKIWNRRCWYIARHLYQQARMRSTVQQEQPWFERCRTALHWAAYHGLEDVAEEVLQGGNTEVDAEDAGQ